MMWLDHRAHTLEPVRAALSLVVGPIQYLADLPVSAGIWAGDTLRSRDTLRTENEQLKLQNLLLKTQLQKLNAVETENARLRKLLHSSRRISERINIAEIIAVDLDPYSRQVVINKGLDANVFEGQPVMDADGVMGQVIHVGALNSTAMLITDPNHGIPVQVNRNGLRAIAVGTGSHQYLDIPNLPNNTDIQPGDLLVTSGLGGRFPPGYPVAKVVSVSTNPTQAYATIEAEPTAQLNRNREVLLAWPVSAPEKHQDGEQDKPQDSNPATGDRS